MTSKDALVTKMLSNYKYECGFAKDIKNLPFLNRLGVFQNNNIRLFDLPDRNTYDNLVCVAVVACYLRKDNFNNYKNILSQLADKCSKIILVYSSNHEYSLDYIFIRSNYKNVVLLDIENKGFDATKYFTGMKYLIDNSIYFDRVMLVNDSIILTRSIEDFFAYQQLYHQYYNFIGLNNSVEIKIHFQSYFLSLDINVAREYINYYYKNIEKVKEFADIIFHFEVLFSDYIINNPKYKSDCFYYVLKICNPSYDYKLMGGDYRYPLFKTKGDKDVNDLIQYY